MKKLFTVLTTGLLTATLWAQSPERISYQAVIRNSNNDLVTNHAIGMKIGILQDSVTGNPVFEEIYNPNPETNANGLVSIKIGDGVALTGNFASINWSNGPYFIRTEVDPTGGTNYTISGTTQLLSVPYAYYANTAGELTNSAVNNITNADINNWNNKLDPEDIDVVPSGFNVIGGTFQTLPIDTKTKIDFTTDNNSGCFNDGNNFSLDNDEYTAPDAGVYFFESFLIIDTRSDPPGNVYVYLNVNGSNSVYQRFYSFVDGGRTILRLNMSLKLEQGDVVSLWAEPTINTTNTMGGNAWGNVRMSGFKVY
ncbi:MAG: hypothetical protein HC896_03840 [Bacteroidales bacterium]|nr:hypothetical protein [Bacteroidales bacterium]